MSLFSENGKAAARKAKAAGIFAAVLMLAAVLIFAAGCGRRPGDNPVPDNSGAPAATEKAAVSTDGSNETAGPAGPGDATPDATEVPAETGGGTAVPDVTPTHVPGETQTTGQEATPTPVHETAQATEPATEPAGEPTVEPTLEPSKEPTAEPATAPTPTPTPTPGPTPEPTGAPPEIDPLRFVIDTALKRDVLSYFANAKFTSVSAGDDASEGGVIVLETKNAGSGGTSTPSVFFKYKAFCEAAGVKNASFAERPFVVLKVRGVNLSNRYVSVMAAGSVNDSETSRREVFRPLDAADGWRYLCFDFTDVANADLLSMFRITFEQFAGGNGEKLEIAEMLFLTAEEAAAYRTEDVYAVQEQTAEGLDLRILQFNIQTENGNSAPFRVRADMYRELVDRVMPDVVGMQEVTVNWRRWLDTYVFNDSYAGVGEPRTAGGEANPIYYRKDKFELLEYGTFWLSDTPDVAGSSFENANYPRICTWVLLKDRATGVSFVHFNTHLDHNGNNSSSDGNTIRKEQMKVIIRFSQRFKELPMFLTGDLNNRRTTSEGKLYALYKMITGVSTVDDGNGGKIKMTLGDARIDSPVTVDKNHLATMTKYYDESSSAYNPQKEPIDYVFYNTLNTVAHSYETFLISRGAYEISDHLPVFTTFTINK